MSFSVKHAAPADSQTPLYERDYYGWIQWNVLAIREGRVQEVDWANVARNWMTWGRAKGGRCVVNWLVC